MFETYSIYFTSLINPCLQHYYCYFRLRTLAVHVCVLKQRLVADTNNDKSTEAAGKASDYYTLRLKKWTTYMLGMYWLMVLWHKTLHAFLKSFFSQRKIDLLDLQWKPSHLLL